MRWPLGAAKMERVQLPGSVGGGGAGGAGFGAVFFAGLGGASAFLTAALAVFLTAEAMLLTSFFCCALAMRV